MADLDNNAAMTPRERSSQLGQVQELLTSSLLKGRGTVWNTGKKMWCHSTSARQQGFLIAISITDRRMVGSGARAIRRDTRTARRHRNVPEVFATGSASIRWSVRRGISLKTVSSDCVGWLHYSIGCMTECPKYLQP